MNRNSFCTDNSDSVERTYQTKDVVVTIDDLAPEEIVKKQTKIISENEEQDIDLANPYILRGLARLDIGEIVCGLSDLERALEFLNKRENREAFDNLADAIGQMRSNMYGEYD